MAVWLGMVTFMVFMKLAMGALDTKKSQKRYLLTVGAVLAILLALRGDNYGDIYDLRVYISFFEKAALTEWENIRGITDFEIGFVILNKLLSYVSSSGRMIIVFEAFFCVFSVCRFIYKNTKEVFWAFFFFVTLGNMGFMLTGLRQSIAICIVLFAVEKAKNRKMVSFMILNAAAVSIHASALVFVISYGLLGSGLFKQKKKRILLLVAAMIVMAPQIINMGKVVSGEINAPQTATFSLNGIVPILIYLAAIVGHIIWVKESQRKQKECGSRDASIGFKMTAVGLGFYFLRFYNRILERISFYYLQGSVIALADVIGQLKHKKDGRLIELAAIVLGMILFYHRLDSACYANYVFFWSV